MIPEAVPMAEAATANGNLRKVAESLDITGLLPLSPFPCPAVRERMMTRRSSEIVRSMMIMAVFPLKVLIG
jgi:hypothetical protein